MRIYILLCCLCAASLSLADTAELVLAEYLKLKLLDGEAVDSGFWGRKREFSLSPGQHVLVLEYEQVFARDHQNQEIVSSEPIRLDFVAEGGHRYGIAAQSVPQTIEQARGFVAEPSLRVSDIQSAAAVAFSQEYRPKQPFRLAELVKVSQPAASSGAAASVPAVPEAESMLRYWWARAGAQERAAFLRWIEQQ